MHICYNAVHVCMLFYLRYSEFRLGDTLETQADAFVVKIPQLIYVHRGLTIMDRTSAVLVLALAAAFIPVAVLGEKSKYAEPGQWIKKNH